MITLSEQLLTLHEARDVIPGKPHRATVYRWLSRGVHGARLESIFIGQSRYTSREAIARFIEAQNAPAEGVAHA